MTANTNLIHAIADALIEAHGQDATEWLECGGRATVERGLAGWRAAITNRAWIDRPEDILVPRAHFSRPRSDKPSRPYARAAANPPRSRSQRRRTPHSVLPETAHLTRPR